jgi:hypothetical protein
MAVLFFGAKRACHELVEDLWAKVSANAPFDKLRVIGPANVMVNI